MSPTLPTSLIKMNINKCKVYDRGRERGREKEGKVFCTQNGTDLPILNATFAYHSWVPQPKWILPNAIHSVASIRLITCGHMHLAVYNKIKPKLINNSIASALKCGLNILRKLEAKVESLLFFFHVIIHIRMSYLLNFFFTQFFFYF